MKNRSLKFKIVTTAMLFLFIVGALAPLALLIAQKYIITNYENSAVEDQKKIVHEMLDAHMQSLIGRATGWLAASASRSLQQQEPNLRAYEGSLLGFGNSVNASHDVKKIELYDKNLKKLVDYNNDNTSASFKNAENNITEVLKSSMETGSRISKMIIADNGEPFFILSIPSEDYHDEVSFANLFIMTTKPLLAHVSKAYGYPTSLYSEGHLSMPKEYEEDLSFLSASNSAITDYKSQLWRKRSFTFAPDNFFNTSARFDSYVNVTELEASFKWLQIITISTIVGLTIIAALILYFFTDYLIRPLIALVEQFKAVSQSTNLISNKLSRSSQSTMNNIAEQANAVDSTVSASDEISALLENNEEAVKNTNELSTRSKQLADESLEVMSTMISEIKKVEQSYQEIKSEITRNNSEMKNVITVIEKIAEKTNIINDIVFQTKLLSFNASVEAARAGEAGKGFAVVADEIGKLATTSGSAATEIAGLVSHSTSIVKETVETAAQRTEEIVSAGRGSVEEAIRVGATCEKSITNVRDNFLQVETAIRNLTQSIGEQVISVQSISSSMRTIQDLSQKSQANVREVEGESKTLTQESQRIQQAVSRLELAFIGSAANHQKPSSSNNETSASGSKNDSGGA